MALAVIVAIGWAAMTHGPAQIIKFPNGDRYRFVGTSWGTNHSQPRLLAHVVDHLPDKWAGYIRKRLGPRVGLAPPVHTSSPQLLVWFEQTGTNATLVTARGVVMYNIFLADGNGMQGGMQGARANTAPWAALAFSYIPHRSRMLEFQLTFLDPVFERRPIEPVRFLNPLFGHYPQWQPETLPMEKSDGDLRVQLTDLFTRPRPGGNGYRDTVFSLGIHPARTNEKWGLDGLDLSDATGNHMHMNYPDWVAEGTNAVPLALWPDETAWRLKFTLKRVAGFPDADLVMFSNLLLPTPGPGPAVGSSLTNVVGGITVVAANSEGNNGVTGERYLIEAELPGRPPGMRVDIMDVVTDTGEKLNSSALNSTSSYPVSTWQFLHAPIGAKSVNVTVAVQKERVVEFLAKPVESK